jgi:hypothetical protein
MKAKVPQFRSTRSVTVETDATVGATVGVNLYNKDGTLFDPGAAVAQPSDDSDANSGPALDDVQVSGDGVATVDGSLATGALSVGVDLANGWLLL